MIHLLGYRIQDAKISQKKKARLLHWCPVPLSLRGTIISGLFAI